MTLINVLLKADTVVEDIPDRLDRLLDRQEARIAQVFRVAIRQLKNEVDLDELADLIEAGRVNEALDRLKIAAEKLGAASNVAFVTSGQSTADFLSNAGVARIAFDQVNLYAVAAMQETRLELIREFTAEQLRATSRALVAGVEGGTNPRAQARNFRDSIGLTTKQWEHVANYRRALERVGKETGAGTDAKSRELRDRRGDRTIDRAVREKKPLTPAQIDLMVERYTARYVKYRSEVIGRTEALRAVNQGNEEAFRQAIASGTLRAEQLDREWRTRVDGRERRTHRLLAGEKKGWGEAWVTENGNVLRYPGDPDAPGEETIQCRCAILTRIKPA